MIFAVSFNLLAIEYLLDTPIANLINQVKQLSDNFWGFSQIDMIDFDTFCMKANQKISELLNVDIDNRKQQLFNFIYSSNGAMTVKELSENVFWRSRQFFLNRLLNFFLYSRNNRKGYAQ